MQTFDPSGVAIKNGNFFGFPYSLDESEIVVIPVPWDVTTSYRDGTSRGPLAMLEASYQLDFTSPYRARAWETRISTLPVSSPWMEENRDLRVKAKTVIQALERGEEASAALLDEINKRSALFHAAVEKEVERALEAGKHVVTLGGDHSISIGPIRAHAKKYSQLSVLHIDAHADLRVAYEGFEHSHASIMNHVKEIPQVDALVQVGLRDLSPDEFSEIESNKKIHAHFDWSIRRQSARGVSWVAQCQEMIKPLGKNVYLSFDIDGLDPKYCPNTGTPVAGGLDLWEFYVLLEEVQASGRRIVGADLVEVAPSHTSDEWDCNVGARILYQTCQFVRNSF